MNVSGYEVDFLFVKNQSPLHAGSRNKIDQSLESHDLMSIALHDNLQDYEVCVITSQEKYR
jgi:hypothetical protein